MRNIDIFAYFPEKKLDVVKHIINILTETSKIPISRIEYGEYKDNLSVCFKVPMHNVKFVLEKILFNNIDVFPADDHISAIINEVSTKMFSKPSITNTASLELLNNESTDKEKQGLKIISDLQLSKLFKQGNYKSLYEIIKNTTTVDFETIKRAKELLLPTIRQAIQLNYMGGLSSSDNTRTFINNLIDIISNEKIKVITDFDIAKEAGTHLVELCAAKAINSLIDIANLPKIKQDINIAAIIKYGTIIRPKVDSYKREINYAVKHLNIKYLMLCFDVASVNFNVPSVEIFNWVIHFLQEKKNKV